MPFETVKEYTVDTVGVAVGLAAVVEDNPAPLQVYVVAPLEGLAFNVTVPPLQIGPLLVGLALGTALTVTGVTVKQPVAAV